VRPGGPSDAVCARIEQGRVGRDAASFSAISLKAQRSTAHLPAPGCDCGFVAANGRARLIRDPQGRSRICRRQADRASSFHRTSHFQPPTRQRSRGGPPEPQGAVWRAGDGDHGRYARPQKPGFYFEFRVAGRPALRKIGKIQIIIRPRVCLEARITGEKPEPPKGVDAPDGAPPIGRVCSQKRPALPLAIAVWGEYVTHRTTIFASSPPHGDATLRHSALIKIMLCRDRATHLFFNIAAGEMPTRDNARLGNARTLEIVMTKRPKRSIAIRLNLSRSKEFPSGATAGYESFAPLERWPAYRPSQWQKHS